MSRTTCDRGIYGLSAGAHTLARGGRSVSEIAAAYTRRARTRAISSRFSGRLTAAGASAHTSVRWRSGTGTANTGRRARIVTGAAAVFPGFARAKRAPAVAAGVSGALRGYGATGRDFIRWGRPRFARLPSAGADGGRPRGGWAGGGSSPLRLRGRALRTPRPAAIDLSKDLPRVFVDRHAGGSRPRRSRRRATPLAKNKKKPTNITVD